MMPTVVGVIAVVMALILAVRALRWRRFSSRGKLLMIAAWVAIIVGLTLALQYASIR